MGKLIKMQEIRKYVTPWSATVTGGAFDLFHVAHLRFLRKCSELGRPLVVLVQSDKTISRRKGFNRPVIAERNRAELIAALDFVDFVLITDKGFDASSIRTVKPGVVAIAKENMRFRISKKRELEKEFPKMRVVFVEKTSKRISTTKIIEKINKKRDYAAVKDPIRRRLYFLMDNNTTDLGNVAAIITKHGKIISEGVNDEDRDVHAEIAAIRLAKQRERCLEGSTLFLTMPPCSLCAKRIIKEGIKEVFYLENYTNRGKNFLFVKEGVKMRKY